MVTEQAEKEEKAEKEELPLCWTKLTTLRGGVSWIGWRILDGVSSATFA